MTFEQRMIEAHDRVRDAMIAAAQAELPWLVTKLRISDDECLGIVAGAALSLTVGTWAAQSNLSLDERNKLMDEINAACIKFFAGYPNTTVNIYDPQ